MTAKKDPWDKPNPKTKTGKTTHLTEAQKKEAKATAKKAGRPYPNMVDNMNEAKKVKKRATKK